MMQLLTASLDDLSSALAAREITSVGLVLSCLERIAAFDRAGPRLNAVPVLNPQALVEAHASDLRRREGRALGPFDGIPFTVKDSYKVKDLTVAAGSPAFAELIAQDDAFTVAQLRAAGAVLIGKTNMPPMANGGMQRGLYGRAESPYNGDFLTSAFASGSSNGSGTATAAGFAAFGLAEETWSSGRAPAACNALCAWTPSRGLVSIRGNWPLVPTMDVVVPHTRSVADLVALLPLLTAPDPERRGDFWRMQPWIHLPRPELHPQPADLRGKRLALPRMYVNADPQAGTADLPGIGGPTGLPIRTRASILSLLDRVVATLEKAGAEIVLSDFPLIERYEGDRPGRPTIWTRGLVPAGFKQTEILDLSVWSWDDFLRANGHPGLAEIDGSRIFPQPEGSLPDRFHGFGDELAVYPDHARTHPRDDFRDLPGLEEALHGLETTRRIDLEDWMDLHGFDAVIFPTLADVAPADADRNPVSADIAWSNGVWVANGNMALRHLGVPSVTVPMGLMEDTGMPAGLTFAGRAYDDARLIGLALAWEALAPPRPLPSRTPEITPWPCVAAQPNPAPRLFRQGRGLGIEAAASLVRLSLNGQEMDPLADLPETPGALVLALFADGQGAVLEL